MARIRTVKAEIWSDGKFSSLSAWARLLFIGALNFADDEGRLEDDAHQLKIQVFPGDVVECEPLIGEIAATGRWLRYSSDGHKYIQIVNFRKHQRISHPQPSNIPAPFRTDSAPVPHLLRTDSPLRDYREGEEGCSDGTDVEPPFDMEKAVTKIIGAHSKPDYSPLTQQYVIEAINAEAKERSLTLRDAAVYVLQQTRRVAKSIDNPKFAKNAQEFFLGKQYRPPESPVAVLPMESLSVKQSRIEAEYERTHR